MTFSFHRFKLLIIKDWTENKRVFLFSLLALAGAWMALLGLIVVASHTFNPLARMIILGLGLFGVGAIAAVQQFKALGTPASTIRFLHLPASALEKILQALLLSFALILPASLLIFKVTEWISIQAAYRVFLIPADANAMSPLSLSDYLSVVKIYAFSYTVFLAGALLFRRLVLAKTGSFLFAFAIGLSIFNSWLNGFLSGPGPEYQVNSQIFESLTLIQKSTFVQDVVKLPAPWLQFFDWFLYLGIPLYCVVYALVRLRETEV
jgi:hypothetical protein